MRDKRQGRRLGRREAILGTAAGCIVALLPFAEASAQHGSLRPSFVASSPAAAVLGPRTPVTWTIEAVGSQPMMGESQVGPDGKLEIGPYGLVPVAGLTLDQARTAIERHLAAHLRNPRVTLSLAQAGGPMLNPPLTASSEGKFTAFVGEQQQQLAMIGGNPGGWQPASAPLQAPAAEPIPAGSPPAAGWHSAPRLGENVSVQAASSWRPVQGDQHLVPASYQSTRDVPMIAVAGQPEPGGNEQLPTQPRPIPTGPGGEPLSMIPGPDGMVPGPSAYPPGHPPVPREHALISLPPYVIGPPDILLVQSTKQLGEQPIAGQHLIRPDGTIGLGIYGSVHVSGMTLDMAKEAIAAQLRLTIKDYDIRNLAVDVLAYNSQFYYIITDGAGYGEQVIRLPITGGETVLDAISQINGLPVVASRHRVWVARANSGDPAHPKILRVDWNQVVQCGSTATNYQVMPGDRIYVGAQKLIVLDGIIAKILAPFERVAGATLLGATTINTIKTHP